MGILTRRTKKPDPTDLPEDTPTEAVFKDPSPDDTETWEALVAEGKAERSKVTTNEGITVTYMRLV